MTATTPPPNPPSKTNSPRSTTWLSFAALGCVVGLCVLGAAGFALMSATGVLNVQLNVFGTTAPTQEAGLVTAVPSPSATAAASSTPTLTNTPTPSATPSPSATRSPTPVEPLWQAKFVGGCDLFVGENEVRQYGCEDGRYVMLNKQATTRYSYYDVGYDDAIIEAEGRWLDGTGAYEYGIVWRADSDGTKYYVFTVTDDGRYNVSRYQDDKYSDLIPYTSSPLVNTGTTPNRFRVDARGSEFEFYLNDEYIGKATDSNLTSGYVGLFFYNKEPNARVAFDRLAVYSATAALDTPTPLGTPTPSIPPSEIAWDADFIFGCDLFEGENEVRKYGCEGIEYVMLHKQATTRYAYYDTTFEDADIEAEGYYLDGAGAYEYGIVWRANTEGTEYYLFTVTNDGRYNVAIYKDDQYTDLIPYTASPLVNTGAVPNYFRVVVQGSHFDLFLNDEYIGSVTDSNLTQGYVGLFFYNQEPNVRVAFDQLTVSTFTTGTPTPPAGTITPTPNVTATPTPLAATATPTSAVIAPGVYVTGVRLSPGAPKRGQPVTFLVTFANTTKKAQTFRWLVEIWEADTTKRNRYGQADARQREIPIGTSELSTGDSWKVAGGGPCQAFRARVVFEDDQGRPVPFKRPNGTDLWLPFQVCP